MSESIMYLWLICQDDPGFDDYDSAVVVAPSEESARHIHPNNEAEWDDGRDVWVGRSGVASRDGGWTQPWNVSALRIGTADPGRHPGEVVCASFNAG